MHRKINILVIQSIALSGCLQHLDPSFVNFPELGLLEPLKKLFDYRNNVSPEFHEAIGRFLQLVQFKKEFIL